MAKCRLQMLQKPTKANVTACLLWGRAGARARPARRCSSCSGRTVHGLLGRRAHAVIEVGRSARAGRRSSADDPSVGRAPGSRWIGDGFGAGEGPPLRGVGCLVEVAQELGEHQRVRLCVCCIELFNSTWSAAWPAASWTLADRLLELRPRPSGTCKVLDRLTFLVSHALGVVPVETTAELGEAAATIGVHGSHLKPRPIDHDYCRSPRKV